jgi:hypothetical protein
VFAPHLSSAFSPWVVVPAPMLRVCSRFARPRKLRKKEEREEAPLFRLVGRAFIANPLGTAREWGRASAEIPLRTLRGFRRAYAPNGLHATGWVTARVLV